MVSHVVKKIFLKTSKLLIILWNWLYVYVCLILNQTSIKTLLHQCQTFSQLCTCLHVAKQAKQMAKEGIPNLETTANLIHALQKNQYMYIRKRLLHVVLGHYIYDSALIKVAFRVLIQLEKEVFHSSFDATR